ncbi:hypothetical protein GA0111570_10143 [Raineyella antarctica]|uniref:Uncharacterized protein n=1 Tax=Raineyella antarctica TaxID=1577474 RepID=A0A1G6GCT2_9ACTN|nr:hypothetical protein [Raineyella antarctica]SDB79774.1 hypothetical protein GA0111570_10143 [Raineyella antarctica]
MRDNEENFEDRPAGRHEDERERRTEDQRGPQDEGDLAGGQLSEVGRLDPDVDDQGTIPPADLAQQRAQGPGHDYRENAVGNERGEEEVMPRDDR